MAATPQFYDHFVLANQSLQERLGRSGAAINKDSAVFGQQTRSLLQMLNFGRDAVTARAASHLLNMDILYSNNAYLLKLSEGLLLNSIKSITPPKINASTPFKFWSERTYRQWSSLGSISLKDGTKASLLAYRVNAIGSVEGTSDGVEYSALYCAGNYVQQRIDSGFDGYTPGVFAPVYVGETYKSVWSESVEVQLEMNGSDPFYLKLAWSLDELLAMPDTRYAALAMNTPRGLTITLGDGEIFGGGYNDPGKAGIKSVVVTYVKCDSLAPVDNATLKFNSDITVIPGGDVPLLTPLGVGDTADTLRSRAVSEFFAASKITDERDLVTEVMKIPFVKSVGARREYNWPIWTTASVLLEGYNDYTAYVRQGYSDPSLKTDAQRFYESYMYTDARRYSPGDAAVNGADLWVCTDPNYRGAPSARNGWTHFVKLSDGASIGAVYSRYYPSACVYDNATIVLSGLVMKSRRYWTADSRYSRGDVVYHTDTKQLWLALRDGGENVVPGSEDTPIYGGDGSSAQRYWVTREEASLLEDSSGDGSGGMYVNIGHRFDDYEQLTQAVFESEIKGYFNIAGKLGFTSVVVEPLTQVRVSVSCRYTAPYSMQQNVHDYIENYVCYNVGKVLRADELNAALTDTFGLSSVYVTVGMTDRHGGDGIEVALPSAGYVPPSFLNVDLKESL